MQWNGTQFATELGLRLFVVSRLTSLRTSSDFLTTDLNYQQVWRASIGLDLADRKVLEAEVLIWRIVRERAATLMRHSKRESNFFTQRRQPDSCPLLPLPHQAETNPA